MKEKLAHAVDAELQKKALTRLKRVEGQVRGIARMVEDGRYCVDILDQISSVQEALVGIGKLLMKNHLRHCVAHAVKHSDAARREQMYEEIADLVGRQWR